jgi:hypothetical protein
MSSRGKLTVTLEHITDLHTDTDGLKERQQRTLMKEDNGVLFPDFLTVGEDSRNVHILVRSTR